MFTNKQQTAKGTQTKETAKYTSNQKIKEETRRNKQKPAEFQKTATDQPTNQPTIHPKHKTEQNRTGTHIKGYDRDKQTEKIRQTKKSTMKHAFKINISMKELKNGKHTPTYADKQTDKQTNRQTDKQTNKQTNRQTNN